MAVAYELTVFLFQFLLCKPWTLVIPHLNERPSGRHGGVSFEVVVAEVAQIVFRTYTIFPAVAERSIILVVGERTSEGGEGAPVVRIPSDKKRL